MPTLATFSLVPNNDGIITVSLEPPTSIGGTILQFQVLKYFNGNSGLITKTCASGYGGGQSGITITNSGQGILNVSIHAGDTSGLDDGAYAYNLSRLSSGLQTCLSQGYVLLTP